jgi:hypothetical protein
MRIREAATKASAAFLVVARLSDGHRRPGPAAHADVVTDLGIDDFAEAS